MLNTGLASYFRLEDELCLWLRRLQSMHVSLKWPSDAGLTVSALYAKRIQRSRGVER